MKTRDDHRRARILAASSLALAAGLACHPARSGEAPPGPAPRPEPPAPGPVAPPSDPGAPAAPPAPGPAAQYRGYAAINAILRGRIVVEPEDFDLGTYLVATPPFPTLSGTTAADFAAFQAAAQASFAAFQLRDQLTTLMGRWSGVGINNTFQNGLPNGINFLLWEVALRGFAQDLTLVCEVGGAAHAVNALVLRPAADAALKRLCGWQLSEQDLPQAFAALWGAFMGEDAPEGEVDAWTAHFLGGAYRGRPGSEVLSDALLAIFLNPYFLLSE